MQQPTKAVVPAAGFGTRQYPATSAVRKEFFPLVDRNGRPKPALQLLVEEAVESGFEKVCIICGPDTEEMCRRHFSAIDPQDRARFQGKPNALAASARLQDLGRRLSYVRQEQQLGLGHAVWCARDWLAGEPFLMMLGDHTFVSNGERRCAQQLREAWEGHSLTALFPGGPERLPRYGVARGQMVDERRVDLEGFEEKPPLQVARERCSVDRLPGDTFLLHFGMHVFSPAIIEILDEMVQAHDGGRTAEIELTTAQDTMCSREPYEGYVVDGASYDIGSPLGLLEAQVGLALAGEFKDTMTDIWRRENERPGEHTGEPT
jgi:UTP--glucose-1-phosphate uridylyltransferase